MLLARVRAATMAAIFMGALLGGAHGLKAQQPVFPQQPGLQQPGAQPAPAAAPAQMARPAAGPAFRRLIFFTYDQYSYSSHPFYQLTGVDEFQESFAGNGGSGTFGTPDTDRDAGFFEQAIHSLPPFGVEWGWGTDLRFPRSIGVGFDYAHISQKDEDAVVLPVASATDIPRFQMDTYYYAIPVRFYGFDAGGRGINYFLGFSLGVINGNLLVQSDDPNLEDQIISFSDSPVGATRLGIDVTGENFGFRYEIMLINSREVKFDSNPFPGQSETTTLEFSGSLIRISAFYRFM